MIRPQPDTPLGRYIDFVRQRHLAWLQRIAGMQSPWSLDPVIQKRKFTNVFRILDPGTQFVLTDLADDNLKDTFARIFLYRHTNQLEAWQAWKSGVGRYPHADELHLMEDFWLSNDIKVFNGAYNIYPQSTDKGTNKVSSVVRLAHQLFSIGDLAEELMEMRSVAGRVASLKLVPGVGDFMAMQIATDIGYIVGGDEDEYILPGPGAIRGAKIALPMRKPVQAIEAMRDVWATAGDVYIQLPNGKRHYPSLMDVQNTFCEFSKYERYCQRINFDTKPYQPAHPGPQPTPVYPSHWSTS